jgi:hypothetical protein
MWFLCGAVDNSVSVHGSHHLNGSQRDTALEPSARQNTHILSWDRTYTFFSDHITHHRGPSVFYINSVVGICTSEPKLSSSAIPCSPYLTLRSAHDPVMLCSMGSGRKPHSTGLPVSLTASYSVHPSPSAPLSLFSSLEKENKE